MRSFNEQVDTQRKQIICTALWENLGNLSATARALQMHRNTLVRWMTLLNIPTRKALLYSGGMSEKH